MGEQERWAGLRGLSAEKCSGDLVWPELQRNPCNKVTQHKQSKKQKAERKGGGNCSRVGGLLMMKIVRWEHQGAGQNGSSTGRGGFLTRVTTFMSMIFKCLYGEI